MRFGRHLPKHAVSEWEAAFLDYDGLKKRFKLANKALPAIGSDQAKSALLRDVARIERFYQIQLNAIEHRISILFNSINTSPDALESLSPHQDWYGHDSTTALQRLAEIRHEAEKLEWYGAVNRTGFEKLFAKFQAVFGSTIPLQQLSQHPFANQSSLRKYIVFLDQVIAKSSRKSSASLSEAVPAGNFGQNLLVPDDLNTLNEKGETPLYVAAKSGYDDIVRIMLQRKLAGENIDLDLPKAPQQWTPLIAAAAGGHREIVTALLEAGADPNNVDAFSWTAGDHAAYRGFLDVASKLPRTTLTRTQDRLPVGQTKTPSEPITETVIFVNLGPLNSRSTALPVELNHEFSTSYPNPNLFVKLRAVGAVGPETRIQLPILEDLTNSPSRFTTEKFEGMKLFFNVFRTSEQDEDLIGTAIAILAKMPLEIGPNLESTEHDHTIPLLSKETFDAIGTVTFNFLIVKPYSGPKLRSAEESGQWTFDGSTTLIGHRGFGMNRAVTKHLQVGENTILASLTAKDFGVSHIEFDVQLTRDGVPVVFHDNIVAESGADIPPHALTLAQFIKISRLQAPKSLPAFGVKGEVRTPMKKKSRNRSLSLGARGDQRLDDFMGRIQVTDDYETNNFKANVRGKVIHDSFATLENMLRYLPDSIGFDIELKYPMLWEAQDANIPTTGPPLNYFVDTILATVARYASPSRPILFSSFFPELCILASNKQRTYPVCFLSDGGNSPTGDIRAASLQDAVHFAQAWKLPGVVVAAEPLVQAPTLVGHVRARGLLCLSYGGLNNEVATAKIQADAGLDGIVSDELIRLSRSLEGLK